MRETLFMAITNDRKEGQSWVSTITIRKANLNLSNILREVRRNRRKKEILKKN